MLQNPPTQNSGESLDRERETITILALLREKMDDVDSIRRRRSLKERLGLKSMACCGAIWGFRSNNINISDSEDEEHQRQEQSTNSVQNRSDDDPGPDCVDRIRLISGGTNLAAALAAERHLRSADGTNLLGLMVSSDNNNVGPARTVHGTPLRMSLMRLLAETDGCDGEERAGGAGEAGSDSVCCVCMGRKKGAAFIPCGHTLCRVCSREIWLNRGYCPLCNRSILEILEIF